MEGRGTRFHFAFHFASPFSQRSPLTTRQLFTRLGGKGAYAEKNSLSLFVSLSLWLKRDNAAVVYISWELGILAPPYYSAAATVKVSCRLTFLIPLGYPHERTVPETRRFTGLGRADARGQGK